MKSQCRLLFVLFALSLMSSRAEIPTFTRSNSTAIAFFDHEYKKRDRYIPKWSPYLGTAQEDYNKGFDAGLTFALQEFPNLGTDTKVKSILKNNESLSKEYQMGFMSAFEVYSAYQVLSEEIAKAEQGAAANP